MPRKMNRYSISVSGPIYDRLRTSVDGSMASFVDGIVLGALNDPAILARLVSRCRQKPPKEPRP
ncbi:MAG TPA: hypothetical protein VLE97_06175 [Gaiellaceae bacterium]|nr:hypothetical protein [Gaiellaceae bacterium]